MRAEARRTTPNTWHGNPLYDPLRLLPDMETALPFSYTAPAHQLRCESRGLTERSHASQTPSGGNLAPFEVTMERQDPHLR